MENKKLEVVIKDISKEFIEKIKDKDLQIISHFDTDGITSAAIITKALTRIDQKFSLTIIKSLNKKIIEDLDKQKPTLFVDLASNNLNDIVNAGLEKTFIIDHHEVDQKIPNGISIINPELCEKEKISSSGLTYLFAKEIDSINKDSAKLAILGMIGDQMEKEIDILNHGILDDGEIKRKRGLMIYPSTRPLNRVLEYCSDPFIPGVTGDVKGVLELLRESGLSPEGGKYKSLIDLTPQEMENLVTSIILRNPEKKDKDLIGDLFLIKLFGKLEDAREMSAKINACSRDGNPGVAIAFCMENANAKKKADAIHVKYRQQLIAGIRSAQEMEKITGQNFIIINAEEQIKDTMIGTITSILSNSPEYNPGTIIVGLAKDIENNKIKISARVKGKQGRNLRELLVNTMNSFQGEVGGHEFAAGCSIEIEKQNEFIEALKKNLELQVIKV
jgi:single-stranded-DNA-specific exonuclease